MYNPNNPIESDLLEIINLSSEKNSHYKELFEVKRSSILKPLEEDYEQLEKKLSVKLGKYETALSQFSLTLEKANNSISPVKKHMEQLKISSENVKKCIDVVESLISLHDSLSGIRKSLEEDNMEDSCEHIQKALSSSSNVRNMRGQNDSELLDIQNQVFNRLCKELENSEDQKAILKYRKLFAIIGKKDEGIEIYSDFLANHLDQDMESVVDLNLTKCVLIPKNEDDTTFTDLLSEILDYCAASVEKHRPFVEKYYGKERVSKLVEKIGNISNSYIDKICRFYVKIVKSKTFTKKSDISSLVDELAVIYERTKKFKNWILSLIDERESSKTAKTSKKEKKVEYGDIIMKLLIELSDDFLNSSVREIWEKFCVGENLLFLLSPEVQKRISLENSKKKDIQSNSKRKSDKDSEDEEDDEEEGEDDDSYRLDILNISTFQSDFKKTQKLDKFSSVVADFFFVLKRVMETGCLTSDTQIVCVFINKIYDILTTKIQSYLGKFHSHFSSFPIPPISSSGDSNNNENINIEVLVGINTNKSENEFHYPFDIVGSKFYPSPSISKFRYCFISLNNIFRTSVYLTKFKKDVHRRCSRYKNLVRIELISATLHHLDTSSKIYHKLFEDSLKKVVKILNPYIQKIVEDLYMNETYNIPEELYDEYVKNNSLNWIEKLSYQMDIFFEYYKEVMVEEGFEVFVGLIVQIVVSKIKEIMITKKFNLFGGFKFDMEVRELMRYFGKLVTGSVRGKFTILGQYASILRAEKKGDLSVFASEYFTLHEEEIKKIQKLRID